MFIITCQINLRLGQKTDHSLKIVKFQVGTQYNNGLNECNLQQIFKFRLKWYKINVW